MSISLLVNKNTGYALQKYKKNQRTNFVFALMNAVHILHWRAKQKNNYSQQL